MKNKQLLNGTFCEGLYCALITVLFSGTLVTAQAEKFYPASEAVLFDENNEMFTVSGYPIKGFSKPLPMGKTYTLIFEMKGATPITNLSIDPKSDGAQIWAVGVDFGIKEPNRWETKTGAAGAQHLEAMPGTKPLEETNDLAMENLDRVDRFLLKRIERSPATRQRLWTRDVASPEAYRRSVKVNLDSLRRRIGAVDPRKKQRDLQLVATLDSSPIVAESPRLRIVAVRWSVLDGVDAEGLLLEPTGEVRAQVVALPDADQTPEEIAGVGVAGPNKTAFARRLAEAGCRVLVPTVDVDAPPPTEKLGTMLGLSTLKAVSHVTMHEGGSVRVISETVALPRRQNFDERIGALQAEQEKILQFFTGVGCGSHGAGTFLNFKTFLPLYLKHAIDPNHPSYSSYLYRHEAAIGRKDLEHLAAENRKRLQKYLESIHQMERLIRLRSNLQLLEQKRAQSSQGSIRAEIQGMKIGEFVLVTFPGEPFAEVGLRIKKRSPCKYTFVAGYANGCFGYAPTAESYRSPCYENSLTPLAPEWENIYETKALEMIRRLNSDRPAP